MKTRRFLSMLLCVMFVVAMLPGTAGTARAADGYCGGEGEGTNLTWTLDDSGTLTISGTGKMADYSRKYDVP